MFSSEFLELLKQVLKSWQVLAVTVALIIYISIVNRTARRYKRPKSAKVAKIKKVNKQPELTGDVIPEEASSGSNSNDELGLEES